MCPVLKFNSLIKSIKVMQFNLQILLPNIDARIIYTEIIYKFSPVNRFSSEMLRRYILFLVNSFVNVVDFINISCGRFFESLDNI